MKKLVLNIPLVLEDANFSNSRLAGIADHVTGKSQACAPLFKGRNRDSPLEKLHRVRKAFENAISHFQVQWV